MHASVITSLQDPDDEIEADEDDEEKPQEAAKEEEQEDPGPSWAILCHPGPFLKTTPQKGPLLEDQGPHMRRGCLRKHCS